MASSSSSLTKKTSSPLIAEDYLDVFKMLCQPNKLSFLPMLRYDFFQLLKLKANKIIRTRIAEQLQLLPPTRVLNAIIEDILKGIEEKKVKDQDQNLKKAKEAYDLEYGEGTFDSDVDDTIRSPHTSKDQSFIAPPMRTGLFLLNKSKQKALDNKHHLADQYFQLGSKSCDENEHEKGISYLEKSLNVRSTTFDSKIILQDLIRARLNLAVHLFTNQNKTDNKKQLYKEIISPLRKAINEEKATPLPYDEAPILQTSLAGTLNELGVVHTDEKEYEAAIPLIKEALALAEKTLSSSLEIAIIKTDLIRAIHCLGMRQFYEEKSQEATAILNMKEALQIAEPISHILPNKIQYLTLELACMMNVLGVRQCKEGATKSSIEQCHELYTKGFSNYEEAIRIAESIPDPSAVKVFRENLATGLRELTLAHNKHNNSATAHLLFKRYVAVKDQLLKDLEDSVLKDLENSASHQTLRR